MKKPGLILIMLSIVLVCFQQAEAEKYDPAEFGYHDCVSYGEKGEITRVKVI